MPSTQVARNEEPYFLGAHDVAAKKWTSLRSKEYRNSMYKPAYEADVKAFGGELTVEAVNAGLKKMKLRPRRQPSDENLIRDYRELSAASELVHAEPLPTLRFWFHYHGASGIEYIIGGVPDGLADEYCYEFKSPSGGDNSVADNRQIALRQAEIYCHAFRRPLLKVQVVRLRLPGPFPFRWGDV